MEDVSSGTGRAAAPGRVGTPVGRPGGGRGEKPPGGPRPGRERRAGGGGSAPERPGRRTGGALLCALLLLGAPTAGCSGDDARDAFTIGAIPDQDPQLLQRLYGTLSDYLESELEVPVRYEPVTNYAAAVNAFRVGDLDMVWFGGLTGVQARLQVDGAQAILQRGIDAGFHSVFIANRSAGLDSVESAEGLRQLRGHTFTFGSQSSTSGRLMPQHYLGRAGVAMEDFRGEPGFSGSHDKTIRLVEAGSYEAGVANEQVWNRRLAQGRVDTSRVEVIWRTPAYYDYHWVVRPGLEERFGEGFVGRLERAFTELDRDDPRERRILEMFGAEEFIPTENENYRQIERVGRRIGKIQ